MTRRACLLSVVYCLYSWSTVLCEQSLEDCVLSNSDRQFLDLVIWRQGRVGRRDFTTPEPPFHLPHQGPPRTPLYDPTFGYEPYWATGDWVFEIPPEVRGDMCGQACSDHFIDYGVICGRRRDKAFSMEHKTFKNYCEMMNEDCDGKDNWMIAYRGECRSSIKTYPTLAESFVSRAVYYVSQFLVRSRPTRRRSIRTKKRTTTTTTSPPK
ncbi:hypothetical protein O3G_MSEX008030 [Manduca sexta]|uniref:Uncharacterized protein n=1 Tax=Manduca sexta TaxID=7130 RepID=A0A922CPA1_MANSE|nr:hypothetical protein O3G_MSEX008030 [Manduca sexta]